MPSLASVSSPDFTDSNSPMSPPRIFSNSAMPEETVSSSLFSSSSFFSIVSLWEISSSIREASVSSEVTAAPEAWARSRAFLVSVSYSSSSSIFDSTSFLSAGVLFVNSSAIPCSMNDEQMKEL